MEQDGAEAVIGYGGPDVYRVLRPNLPLPVIESDSLFNHNRRGAGPRKAVPEQNCLPVPDNIDEIRLQAL